MVVVRDIESGNGEKYQNIRELEVSDTDIEVLKTFNNAFWQTDLDEILKKLEVDFLIICGNAAEYCVGATYSGANERGYQTTLLQNGVFAVREVSLLTHFYNRELISCTVIEAVVGFDL